MKIHVAIFSVSRAFVGEYKAKMCDCERLSSKVLDRDHYQSFRSQRASD